MGVKRGPVITLGSVTQFFPIGEIQRILITAERQSQRIRKLPAELMVYWTVASGLFVSEGAREVLRRVLRRQAGGWVDQLEDVATESAISQARTRLGSTAVAMVYEALVEPLATRATIGAWYRRWRVVTIDATVLDVADTPANVRAFRRPGVSHGNAAYPQVRLVSFWRMAPTSCSAQRSLAAGHTRQSSHAKSSSGCRKTRSVWPIGPFSVIPSGNKHLPQALSCSGASRATPVFQRSESCPTAPI
jgi:hypothetical protein